MAGVKQRIAPTPVAKTETVEAEFAPKMPKYQLGQQVKAPDIFIPSAQWVQNGYIYRVDAKRLVCKRIAVKWRSSSPVYFLITRQNMDEQSCRLAANKPRWRRPMLSLAVTCSMAAVCLLIYPYYPEVTYSVKQSFPHRASTQAVEVPVTALNQLSIPKIGVTAAVLEAPTLDILDREQGVWHQLGDVKDNFVVAGHRFKYLPPNTTTFYNLNKLEPGDTAVVDYSGKRLVYVVREVRKVKATEISILNPTSTPQLTLYTCSDKRETERIVVHADLLP